MRGAESERGVSPLVAGPLLTGLGCSCPRCGRGRLFRSFLTVAERCSVCDLDLQAADSGDGPAVFLIFLLGGLIVPIMLLLDAWLSPPLWVHAGVGGLLILGGALALLRPFKATILALHYRHKVSDRGWPSDA